MRDPKLYLKDIIESVDSIEKFVEGISFEGFKKDDMRVSAVLRKFEVIGEASKNVPEEIKQKHTEIPWRDMARMRDRLIHFYFGVKHDLVWNAIKGDIPRIKPLLKKILEEMESEKSPES